MCASARMVVKRKGAERPAVVACTLLPYDPQFELGSDAGRKRRRRAPQPSALRQVLRAGRRGLQPVTTDIDVVIPTLNAARSLAPTLDSLGGDHGLRLAVTVCDGGSRDDTTAIARQAGATVLVTEPGRGRQLARRRRGGQRAVAAVPSCRHDPVDRLGRRRAPIHGHAHAKGRLLPAALRVGRSARPTPGAPRRLALPHLRPALRRPGTPDRARLLSPPGGFRALPLMEDVDFVRRIGRRQSFSPRRRGRHLGGALRTRRLASSPHAQPRLPGALFCRPVAQPSSGGCTDEASPRDLRPRPAVRARQAAAGARRSGLSRRCASIARRSTARSAPCRAIDAGRSGCSSRPTMLLGHPAWRGVQRRACAARGTAISANA